MKRYIKEFATDRIKSLEYAREDIKQKAIERIEKALNLNGRNYITDCEAVEMILNAEKYVTSMK